MVPPDVTPRDLLTPYVTWLGSTVAPCGDRSNVRASPKVILNYTMTNSDCSTWVVLVSPQRVALGDHVDEPGTPSGSPDQTGYRRVLPFWPT